MHNPGPLPRTPADVGSLLLPACAIPRPGDMVVWYQGGMKMEGSLLGHRWDGSPIIKSRFGQISVPPAYDWIRRRNLKEAVGPAWTELPAEAVVVSPRETERSEYDRLLHRSTPPGPRYMDLIEEIWTRGFEVFLVGGTVRDVLAGQSPKDVDLVTSMPLQLLRPLMESMYRDSELAPAAQRNGHVRLGGRMGTTDPFIDLCVFKLGAPGTKDATFGCNFSADIAHRDFACNSVYYDPKNAVLIDPSGRGILDAESNMLHVVADEACRSPFHIGQLVVRFFKFRCRGFRATVECEGFVQERAPTALASMTAEQLQRYTASQLVAKCEKTDRRRTVEAFQAAIVAAGLKDLWEHYFAPIAEEICDA